MNRAEFLAGVDADLDHRILLWEAMQLTDGKVVELGSGHGSTPWLKKHCFDVNRVFESYEHDPFWAKQMGAFLIKNSNWEELNLLVADVLFIDHRPAERRKEDLVKYADMAKIIVIHDTEPTLDPVYQTRQYYPSFKYWMDLKTSTVWATMVSNFVDLSGCEGLEYPYGKEIFKIVKMKG